jgi:hypothetical protein
MAVPKGVDARSRHAVARGHLYSAPDQIMNHLHRQFRRLRNLVRHLHPMPVPDLPVDHSVGRFRLVGRHGQLEY